jgi:ArsR family transcriptional regulator
MRQLADTFKALSDETRLQIIALLLEQEELCVCDFVGTLEQTQSKISRHLRYLYHAGLVADRREGLWMHYRISPDLTAGQRVVLAALAEAIDDERRSGLHQRFEAWLGRKDEGSATCGTDARVTARR